MNATATVDQAKSMASLLLELTRRLFIPSDDRLAAMLPLAQLRVCAILYRGARSMSALGRELGVSQSAMTQIADRLERAGLVHRVTEETDRRVRSLQLTPRGEKIMRSREADRVERVTAILDRLSPKARNQALSTLEMLADACTAAESLPFTPSVAKASR
ncbi:MAG: MarR family winged helix-turn-helix transcriptional regulator [Pirellulales bacterium]